MDLAAHLRQWIGLSIMFGEVIVKQKCLPWLPAYRYGAAPPVIPAFLTLLLWWSFRAPLFQHYSSNAYKY